MNDRIRESGLRSDGTSIGAGDPEAKALVQYINIKLAALGRDVVTGEPGTTDVGFVEVASDLLAHHRETGRLLDDYLCPADQRIQGFLDDHLAGLDLNGSIRLPRPRDTFLADRHGLARELSLPLGKNHYRTELLESFRARQGVLHNPRSDRRTTSGVFHVAEGGLPIPADKKSVPLRVFGNLLHAALHPPADLLRVPFAAEAAKPLEMFISLMLRPTVVPEVPGTSPRMSMEVRLFAPGALVSNLDFAESIFGNAGNPYLPENDAGIDVEHWTGHTGCILLAPHLVHVRKRDVGLPHFDQATEQQRAQGMCWRDADERYNDGGAFKITCRTAAGVMFTIVADNYFGYTKKEVKTQISFAANLFGAAEEEHAGGALTFPCYLQGQRYLAGSKLESSGQTFADTVKALGDAIDVFPEGYALDRAFPSIVYVPSDVAIDVATQRVSWTSSDGVARSIKLLAGNVYVLPTGYKVRLQKHGGAPSWRLIGTAAEGTFLHKPCTVSGGGKSEISKSLDGAISYGPIFTSDIAADLDAVEAICTRDYADRFPPRAGDSATHASRPVLSERRSLGSVIKLLTPSPEYTPAYNAWLASIPEHVRPLVFIIKRFYQPEWGDDWRSHFTVDDVNGAPGHELKIDDRRLVGSYLRVGFTADGDDRAGRGWRLHKMRQDFIAADKVQMEDDISASTIVPRERIPNLPAGYASHPSVKIVENCEWRLFQRPDDAIHRGRDAQAERDMAQPGLFASNYQAVTTAEAHEMTEDVVSFGQFTPPMRALIAAAAQVPRDDAYLVCSANPRLVDGKPTKNPRYLQTRPDVAVPRDRHLAQISTRLFRRLRPADAVAFPVSSVLAGRRNNPPDAAAGIRALAVYNPIHFQELPELFMDYICSLTGKSPSTTGAGSEGALTKGPFNALLPSTDLNNALVGYILTNYPGFTTAAGYVGPRVRVEHDVSMLVPELWSRLPVAQRDPKFLIANGYLEKLNDFNHNGRLVLASRLGYRITEKFVHDFFGKIFDNPSRVFDEALLRPETQDLDAFVDGIDNIVEAQQRVAASYMTDGSFERCCPPLQSLLRIMADGAKVDPGAIAEPGLRESFSRERLLESDWYAARLKVKQTRDAALWARHVKALEAFAGRSSHEDIAERLDIAGRLERARAMVDRVARDDYLSTLAGTIGADPL